MFNRVKSSLPKHRGQSFVELALALPVILLMIGGMVEVAFFINAYLDLLDASREGARYGANLDYSYADPTLVIDDPLLPGTNYCNSATTHFYVVIGCLVEDNLLRVGNLHYNNGTDDILISAFSVQDKVVQDRFPDDGDDEAWSYATINPATADLTDPTTLDSVGCGATPCRSRVSNANVEDWLNDVANPTTFELNDGFVLVEVFYSHQQILELPFYNLLPDTMQMYAYTFFPLPSAEPTPTNIP